MVHYVGHTFDMHKNLIHRFACHECATQHKQGHELPSHWWFEDPHPYCHYCGEFINVPRGPNQLPWAVICDLDGTLASCEWRRHHVMQDPPNWPAFFDGMNADAPIPEVVDALQAMKWIKILVSGRPDNYRYQTEWWLMEHGIRYDHLFMRSHKDQRSDDVVKKEIFEKYIWPHYRVVYVLDDRPMVIAMWKELELNVDQVEDPGLDPILKEDQ